MKLSDLRLEVGRAKDAVVTAIKSRQPVQEVNRLITYHHSIAEDLKFAQENNYQDDDEVYIFEVAQPRQLTASDDQQSICA